MHSSAHRRPTDVDAAAESAPSVRDDPSLLPAAFAPTQLFRTRSSIDTPATFATLPRIILQLVNGFLSLKELGAWCLVCRDVYATAAFFRCPLNTVAGGIRQRWLVTGREFVRPRLKQLLKSPLRIQVTIVEASDPHGGLLHEGDCDRLRALPFLTDLHAHYKFEKPWDWADEIARLVTREALDGEADATRVESVLTSSASSSSTSSVLSLSRANSRVVPQSPFRSLMLCPHDPEIDGSEPEEDEEDEEMDLNAEYQGDAAASSSSSSQSQPKKKDDKKKAKKKPKTQAELAAEDEALAKSESEHLARWSQVNQRLFQMLPKFGSLDTLGLNLIGECTNWDVSGFKVLQNLTTLELDVESPWNHAFARQLSEILEYVRDVPYRQLHRLQSNGLHVKHLQQLVRPRLPTDAQQEEPPVLNTLWTFKCYGDGAPASVRVQTDQWELEQDEAFIRPHVVRFDDDDDEKYQKRVQAACDPLSADTILDLYSRLPNLRQLDLVGFLTPLTDEGYDRLASFAEIDTLAVGGVHPSQLRDANGGGAGDHPDEDDEELLSAAMPTLADAFVRAMRDTARKEIKVDRLTVSYVKMEESAAAGWTPAIDSSTTPLHDALFYFAPCLIELELNTVSGLKDLTAITQCTKLQVVKLTALHGFRVTKSAIESLSVLTDLRSLRLSHMILPPGLVDLLKVPSKLLPSLQDFAADQPHLQLIDQNGAPLDPAGMGIDLSQLGLPPNLGWIGNWLQSQGIAFNDAAAMGGAAGAAAAAAAGDDDDDEGAAAAPAAPAPTGPMAQLGSLYQQLMGQMVAAAQHTFGVGGGHAHHDDDEGNEDDSDPDDLPDLTDESNDEAPEVD